MDTSFTDPGGFAQPSQAAHTMPPYSPQYGANKLKSLPRRGRPQPRRERAQEQRLLRSQRRTGGQPGLEALQREQESSGGDEG